MRPRSRLLPGFVAAAIDRFNRRHPRLVCHLMAEGTAGLRGALEARQIDLLISYIILQECLPDYQ